MFDNESRQKNTIKRGAKTIAERVLVMLLSFMMVIQVIPFSMYGFEGLFSHADASASADASADAAKKPTSYEYILKSFDNLDSDEEIDDLTGRLELILAKGRVSMIKGLYETFTNKSKAAKALSADSSKLVVGEDLLDTEQKEQYTKFVLPLLEKKLETINTKLNNLDYDGLSSVIKGKLSEDAYNNASDEFKDIIIQLNALSLTEDEISTLYSDKELGLQINIVTRTIPNAVEELESDEKSLFEDAFGTLVGPQNELHKMQLQRRIEIDGQPYRGNCNVSWSTTHVYYVSWYGRTFYSSSYSSFNMESYVSFEYINPSPGSGTTCYPYLYTNYSSHTGISTTMSYSMKGDDSDYCSRTGSDWNIYYTNPSYNGILDSSHHFDFGGCSLYAPYTYSCKRSLTMPASVSFRYDGNPHWVDDKVVWKNNNNNRNSYYASAVSGYSTLSATAPGTYAVLYRPNSYCAWYDYGCSTSDRYYYWTIEKGTKSVTFSDQSFNKSCATSDQTFNVTAASQSVSDGKSITYAKSFETDSSGKSTSYFDVSGTQITQKGYTPVGTYKVGVKATSPSSSYYNEANKLATMTVTVDNKVANGITAPATQNWNAACSAGAQTLNKLPACPNASTDVTYALSSVQKGTTNITSSNYFSILDSNKVQMAANVPAGTYTLNVSATAKEDGFYNSKTVTFPVNITVSAKENTVRPPANQQWELNNNATASKSLTGVLDPVGAVTYTISDVKKDGASVKSQNYFTNSGTTLTMAKSQTPAGTYIVTMNAEAAGDGTYSKKSVTFDVEVKVNDKINPTASIANYTKDIANKQTITLGGSDVDGDLAMYYFGTSSTGIPDKVWATTNTETVYSQGTYYLITQDKAGNKSTAASIKFYETKLTVTNGQATPKIVLSKAGDSFTVPNITAKAGYSVPASYTWQVGETATTVAKNASYTPAGNNELKVTLPASDITFAGKTVDLTSGSGAQFVDISGAAGGTGDYTYTIVSQPAGNYFKISHNNKVEISTDLTSGTYTIRIKAHDNETGKEQEADYKFTITKTVGDLALDKDSLTVKNLKTGTITVVKNVSGGELGVTSDDLEIAKGEVSGNTITVSTGGKLGTTNLTITAHATKTHEAVSVTIPVTVTKGDFEITAIPVNTSSDGQPHAASLKADTDGVTVVYGTDYTYEDGTIHNLGKDPVEMKNVTRTSIGTTTVYYKATKPGCNEVTGSVEITLLDGTVPTATIKDVTHKAAAKQTVTLSASDVNGIEYWYFGTKKDPAENEYERILEPQENFEKQKVEIDSAKTYYLIAKDTNGTIGRTQMTFVRIEVSAENGDAELPTIIAQKGVENDMPKVTAHTGYTEPETWELSTLSIAPGGLPIDETVTVSSDGKYVPNGSGTLVAKCVENKFTLSYDNNGIGTATAEPTTMYFTKEATAGPAISADGWVFTGWNDKANGKGNMYAPGDTVKKPGEERLDTILYAIWEPEELIFEDQTISCDASENAQLVDISGASKGSGQYEYEVIAETNGEHFTVSDDSKIEIAAKTPADEYFVAIQVTDKETGGEKVAYYTFNIDLATPAVKLTPNSVLMATDAEETITVEKPADVDITVTSLNPVVATAMLDGDSAFKINSTKKEGSTDIVVKTAETEIYKSIEIPCQVTVGNREFEITKTPVSAEANGTTYAACVTSSLDDVVLKYGTDESNLNHTLHIESSGMAVALSAESRSEICNDTIYYRASKDGYKDVTGNATIKLTDNTDPTGTIENPSRDFSNKQTVTLKAYDVNKVTGIYFGTNENGEPEAIPSAVQNFTRENVEVSEGKGTYYFRVKDIAGNVKTVDTMRFYGTSFDVINGKAISPVITASGNAVILPDIEANTGYRVDETVHWQHASDVDLSAGATYYPAADLTLTADCIERTAILKYDANIHSIGVVASAEMSYTATAEATEELSADGYTFNGWAEDENGKGELFTVGSVFKPANVVPKDTTLYAQWTKNEIELEDKSIELTAKKAAQLVEISSAANGTGDYEYTLPEEGQTDNKYFEISGNSKIEVKAGTPAGKYTVTVHAKDRETEKETTAVYTFNISISVPTLVLSSDSIEMETSSEATMNLSNPMHVGLTVSTDNPEIAAVELSGDSVVIKSTNKKGTANVTVTTVKSGDYESTSKTFELKVKYRPIEITPVEIIATADGSMHAPTVKSDIDGVELIYGIDGKYNHVLQMTSANTAYSLADVARAKVGTTKITYKANRTGYEEEQGEFYFTVTAGDVATGTITDASNVWSDKQTVNLYATDPNKIVGFYFGKDASAEPKALPSEVTVFERERVDVASGEGTYYFKVKDGAGREQIVDTIKFYKTTFTVENGKAEVSGKQVTSILTASDQPIVLPEIVPNVGYRLGDVAVGDSVSWKNGAIDLSAGAEYTPTNDLTLKADCIERTATLTYDKKGHGTEATAGPTTLYYTKEATAAAELTQDGYTFLGWTMDSECKGEIFNAGDTIKGANAIPEDITLYAKWKDNSLEFNNVSFDLTASESLQTVEISGAANGTGNYHYYIPQEGQTDARHFSVSDDSKIVVNAGTPAGDYTVTVVAEDAETHVEKSAVYTFHIDYATPILELSGNGATVQMQTDESTSVGFTKTESVDVKVTSKNKGLVTASISDNAIVLSSNEKVGSTKVTIETVKNDVYKSVSKEFQVNVSYKEIVVQVPNVELLADGEEHALKMTSELEGIEFKYGTDEGNLSHVINNVPKNEEIALSSEATKKIETKKIYWKASKSGYEDVTGNAILRIYDENTPIGEIKDITHDFSGTQTVTLSASDNDRIVAYSFSKNKYEALKSITPVKNFEKKGVEVKEKGTYYFRYKDNAGNVGEKTITYFQTDFYVDLGEPIDSVLTPAGYSFQLPEMTPNTGYVAGEIWELGLAEYDVGSYYEPKKDAELEGDCDDIVAYMTYSNNGIGGSAEETEVFVERPMKYSKEYKVEQGISADGYTFQGWTIDPEGKGVVYQPGDVFKAKYVIPVESTLYAKWSTNELEFNNSERNIEASEFAQTVEISSAANGTGKYTYTIPEDKQPDGNYFSISGDSKIEVAGNTPAGKYAVTVDVLDKETHQTATAVYTFNIELATPELELSADCSANTVAIITDATKTVNFTKTENVSAEAVSDKPDVATVQISGDSVVVKSNKKEDSATITVRTIQSDVYKSIEKKFTVYVNNRPIEITPVEVLATADGNLYAPTVKSDIEGVELTYGEGDKYDQVLTIVSADTPYRLNGVERANVGTTTIKYKANKIGYAEQPGTFEFNIVSGLDVVGEIKEQTHDLSNKQTVTLTATDPNKIVGFYFGQDASGEPEALPSAVETFTRERVDVKDGKGTYYFIVEDGAGRIQTVDTMVFYGTDLSTINGEDKETAQVITASGDSFALPEVVAKTGYRVNDTVHWKNAAKSIDLSAGADYKPAADIELEAKCIERTATLTYNKMGHGIEATAGASTLYYTKEATAGAKLTQAGYTFRGWTMDESGKGYVYQAGETIKEANVIPEDITLYAKWTKNDITLADKTINVLSSSEPQIVDISSAANGTGNYVYSIPTIGQTDEEYFEISGDGTQIAIKGGTPSGKYTVTVNVVDTELNVEASAVYTFNIVYTSPELELAETDVTMKTSDTKEIEVTNPLKVALIVSSNNPEVANASYDADEGKLIITSYNKSADARITVQTEKMEGFEVITRTCDVTVKNRTINITTDVTSAEADGTLKSPTVISDIPGVELFYGEDENYERVQNMDISGQAYPLPGVGKINGGTYHVYYKATKVGYDDKYGEFDFEVTDNNLPTGEVTHITNNVQNKQTVTLSASDNDQVVAYYFGTSENGTPIAIEPTKEFLKRNVVVDKPGTWYFRIVDSANNNVKAAELRFYGTEFNATNGEEITPVLTVSGESFPLPQAVAKKGYKVDDTVHWKNTEKGIDLSAGASYKPAADLTLKAECIEKTASLRYDANGLDVATAEAGTLYYTKEATAAAGLSADGYEFEGWTFDAEGKGYVYAPGEKFKEANVIPEDTTLYAKWSNSEITFASKTIDMTASEGAQLVEISSAANGTGHYEYSIEDAGQTNEKHFSVVSGESKIQVAPMTPAGKYDVTVDVLDTKTGEKASAVYTFNIDYATPELSLSENAVAIQTDYTKVVNLTKTEIVSLEASTDKLDVATATISGDSVVIKSGNKQDTATIKVKTVKSDIYKSVERNITVNVTNKTVTIETVVDQATADGTLKAPVISCDVPGVELTYGVGGKYNHILDIVSAGAEYELDGVAQKNVGTIAVNYKANKTGYAEQSGTITFKVVAGEVPTGEIKDVSKLWSNKQTVTLTASDINKITGIYFGTQPNGTPEPLPSEVETFTREKVDVEGPGKYYFIVKDGAGRTETVAELEFFKTAFEVDNTVVDSVLRASGDAITLPAIPEREGYNNAGVKWTGAAEDMSAGAEYIPTSSLTLKATLKEIKATLKYDANGHSVATASDEAMSYTGETKAAAELVDPGYEFIGWTTDPEGKGKVYAPNDVVKAANEVPEDTTLYAKWANKDITLADKTVELTVSENAQTVEISSAANGTGNYEYSIPDAGQLTEKYFSVTDGNKINVAGMTPVGKYDVTVNVRDTKTSAEASAVYTIKIKHATPDLELSSNSVTMKTSETSTVAITKITSGLEAEVSTSDLEVANAELSGNLITITSTNKADTITVTVKTKQTDIYESVKKDITVKVENKKFKITPIVVSGNVGTMLSPTISCDATGVEFKYGVDGKYDHILNIAEAGQEYELDGVAKENGGTTKITYIATKEGYETLDSYFNFTLSDLTPPTGSILSVTDNDSSEQTVTMKASDNDLVAGYYFGTDASGQPTKNIEKMGKNVTIEAVASAGGKYYCKIMDLAENVVEIGTVTFYKTTLVVTPGDITSSILKQSGKSFTLPEIPEIEGYKKDNVNWKGGTVDEAPGTTYTPTESLTLKADCIERTATLKYDNKSHGTKPADVTMRYTLATNTAAGLTQKGYTFKGWNTSSDGISGVTYKANTLFKAAKVVPEDATLYAMWTKNELEFNNQTKNLTASENEQTVSIVDAENGTGNTTYSIPDGGQTSDNYFSISSDGKIHVKAGTPAGKYTVTIKAHDDETLKEATAVYTFDIALADPGLTLTSSVTMETSSQATLAITGNKSSGNLTVESTNTDVATAVISGNKVLVKSTNTKGATDIKLTVAATEIYKSVTKTCHVTVKYKEISVYDEFATYDPDLKEHVAKISSNVAGVELRYGSSYGNYPHVLNIASAGAVYELSGVARMGSDSYTNPVTYVYFEATKPGYETNRGTATITIRDYSSNPQIINITNNMEDEQTVTLKATDEQYIMGYYFGQSSSGTIKDIDPVKNTFTLDNVTVDKPGTWYLRVKNSSGKIDRVSKTFYTATFDVEYGTPAYDSALIASGNKAKLPEISADTGYTAGPELEWTFTDWTYIGHSGDEYGMYGNHTFVTSCNEKSAKLTYNSNGRGIGATETDVITTETMRFTKEVKAKAALSADGYEFIGWNTKANGTGKTYAPGEVVKAAREVPVKTTLYGMWEKKGLSFANKVYDLTTSENAQLVEISGASKGTGSYEYAVVEQESNYFRVTGENMIEIAAKTPSGMHTITVEATDKKTGVTAKATYTFNLSRIDTTLSLASENPTVKVNEKVEVGVINPSNGNLTATSNKPSLVEATISGESLVIAAKDNTGTAIITVKSEMTSLYNAATTTCNVTVKGKTFSVEGISVSAEADGKLHAAKIISHEDGIDLRYGSDENNLSSVISNISSGEAVELSGEAEDITASEGKIIYYRASKAGYDDVHGQVLLTVIDHSGPEASYVTTDKLDDTQTVTLTATDDGSRIVKYYWGTKEWTTLTNDEWKSAEKTYNFEKTVNVTKGGTYHFYAVNESGVINANEVTVTFNEVTFNVNYGSTTLSKVVIENGKSITLPSITAITGYTAPAAWGNGLNPGETYTVTENKSFTVTCTENADEPDDSGDAGVMNIGKPSHNLTIGSELSVNFHFKIPQKYAGGKMIFTIDHDGGTQEVSENPDAPGVFTCKINVNQMKDAISWEYKLGDKSCYSKSSYTFYDYLNEAITEVTDKPLLVDFCKKLWAYGYYAQHFLAESKEQEITHTLIPTPIAEPGSHESELSKYVMETSGSGTNISCDGIKRSLILDSMITMKLIIPLTDECKWDEASLPKIKVDGEEIDPSNVELEGKQLTINITDIKIKFLDQEYTVEVGDELIMKKVSAMVYANLIYGDETSQYAKGLANALYELCTSAKSYRQ